jgi:hypothetical protein
MANKPPKHKLTWNKDHLTIAKHLYLGKTPKEVALITGKSYDLCYKVEKAIKFGDVPADVSDDAIEAAKESKGFGVIPDEFLLKKDESEMPEAENTQETSEATPPEAPGEILMPVPPAGKAKGTNGKKPLQPPKSGFMPNLGVSQTMMLQLVPQVQQLPLTPEIFMSYMCAIKKGYKGGIAGWLSVVALDFWTGRNVDPFAEVSGVYDLTGVQTPVSGGNGSQEEVESGYTGG